MLGVLSLFRISKPYYTEVYTGSEQICRVSTRSAETQNLKVDANTDLHPNMADLINVSWRNQEQSKGIAIDKSNQRIVT